MSISLRGMSTGIALTPSPLPSNRPNVSIADCTALAAVWPSPQIDASRITPATSVEQRQLVLAGADRPSGDEPVDRLFLAYGPDPARHALPTALVTEEPRDPQAQVDQVGVLVEDHDDARAERVPTGARVLERQSCVEPVRADEAARRAPEEHRLERLAVADAAGRVDHLGRA